MGKKDISKFVKKLGKIPISNWKEGDNPFSGTLTYNDFITIFGGYRILIEEVNGYYSIHIDRIGNHEDNIYSSSHCVFGHQSHNINRSEEDKKIKPLFKKVQKEYDLYLKEKSKKEKEELEKFIY